MQAEHELFDCVEIMLFGIPLVCHMTWYTEKKNKKHIVLLYSESMTIPIPIADNDL